MDWTLVILTIPLGPPADLQVVLSPVSPQLSDVFIPGCHIVTPLCHALHRLIKTYKVSVPQSLSNTGLT